MLGRALAFAAVAHRDQKDKQGVAYFLHPVRVAEALRLDNWSEIHQTTAVLHDTVEDTDTTLEEIYDSFGSLVGGAVDAITRRGRFGHVKDFHAPGRPTWIWDETYKQYIPRCCQNPIARVVKRYDVYDNANPRRYCDGSPIGRYVWTLEYIQNLEDSKC